MPQFARGMEIYMKQYTVTGMSCAACQARVEKAVNAVPGVESCAVSLLTNSMGVEGDAMPEEIIKAVEKAGYGASLKTGKSSGTSGSGSNIGDGAVGNGEPGNNTSGVNSDGLSDTETPKMRKRLIASLILLIPLMYVSMGHMMWNWPLPPFMIGNHIAMGLYELILTGLIMVINQKFFISGFKGVIHRAPNMDTLVALGSMASFAYSVYALFAMSVKYTQGMHEAATAYMEEFYFESAAMILTLITVGKLLEARSKGKTTNALKALMKLAPKTALILKDGEEQIVPIDSVRVGDVFVVKPGAQIPVDGVVVEGFSAVDESAFTGESIPVEKNAGDTVSAATMNLNGNMVCEATKVGEDTSLAKVIQMVSDAAATKAPIAKIADKVSGIFVPVVIAIAVITFIVWMLISREIGYSLARAISVLVISCPCALGLATPVAIMVGSGVGARNGILFKTAVTLEQVGAVQIVALDKTGTITTGKMQVTDIIPADGVTEDELLTLAAALEIKSEHPISRAITSCYEEKVGNTASLPAADEFMAVAGNGLTAVVGTAILSGDSGEEDHHEKSADAGSNTKDRIYGGNAEYIISSAGISLKETETAAKELSRKGKTPIYFALEKKLIGMIAVADTLKPDSVDAVKQLKNLGLKVVMLTGDNEITAGAIADEVGVDDVVASVKPDGKAEVIEALAGIGKVAMVGDGINDAPALTKADVGIAIGSGTDIAIDAADIVLTKSSLTDVAAAIRISRHTIRNIYENLFWAFGYNIIGIPLAAGCFAAAFGWSMNPMFGAAAMSVSSFLVVSNALRLNTIKIYNTKHDRPLRKSVKSLENISANNLPDIVIEKEINNTMKITVKGMMCPHCEAHVKEALEKIAGIDEAVANHKENLVTLTTSADVAEADIKAAVEAAGYEYAGIQ